MRLWDSKTGGLFLQASIGTPLFSEEDKLELMGDPLLDPRLGLGPMNMTHGVSSARFTADETRILAISDTGAALSIDIDYDRSISALELQQSVEKRTGTYLSETGALRYLTRGEWLERRDILRVRRGGPTRMTYDIFRKK